eukprot:754461-Prymnesium_polylepis.1
MRKGSSCPAREMSARSPTLVRTGVQQRLTRSSKEETSCCELNWPTVRCGTKAPRSCWSVQCGKARTQASSSACHSSPAACGAIQAVNDFLLCAKWRTLCSAASNGAMSCRATASVAAAASNSSSGTNG